MATVEGDDYQSEVHCGAAALRNVTTYYGWPYGEVASVVGDAVDCEEALFEDPAEEFGVRGGRE